MKYILLILLLLGCSRPNLTPVYEITRGYATSQALGFRSTFNVVKTPGGGTKSYWNSATFLLADGRTGWMQGGVHDNKPFYQTPDAFPYSQPYTNGIVLNQMPQLSKVLTVTYYINSEGYPTINMNGVDLCYWPIQAVAVIDGDVAVESYPAFSGNFPTVTFYPAFEFLKEGVWMAATTATSRGGGYGIAGKNQNPLLGANQIQAGGKVPKTNNGDILF
jgi:hypothetical protein